MREFSRLPLGLRLLPPLYATAFLVGAAGTIPAQAQQMRRDPPGQARDTVRSLPLETRAPAAGRGDAARAGQGTPNTSSNIGRDTAIPSFGTPVIQGNTVGGSGNSASGPKQNRPGSTTDGGGKKDPITRDEFGRAKQLDEAVNGKSRRLRDEANGKAKNAPGSTTGADLVSGQQGSSGGLYTRPQTSKRGQQSEDGGGRLMSSSGALPPPAPQDAKIEGGRPAFVPRNSGPAVHPGRTPLSNGDEAGVSGGVVDSQMANRPTSGVLSRGGIWTQGDVIIRVNQPRRNGNNSRPAPDSVDSGNPMRPASLGNTGSGPADPVDAERKRKRQVSQPGEREAREANLQALRGRRPDSSFGTDPNVVNPTRGDGTSATRPANPAGASRPGNQPGGRNCPADNPTC